MKNKKNYTLIIQIIEILSDMRSNHIKELINKLIILNRLSDEERDKLIQTNNDDLIIKSFDQQVQIALTHLLVLEFIKADKNWSFNIEYTTSYCLTEKGLKFINENKTITVCEKITLIKKEIDKITESLKRRP
jgi:predicted metalloprotease